MDFISAEIGIVLILLFVGPILYMIYRQSTKDKRRLTNLKNLGAQNQMTLDHVELTNSLILGLDSSTKKLIIVDPENFTQYDVIDLQKINESAVSKKSISSPTNKQKVSITHIALELLKNKPKEKVTEIVFYDEDDDSSYDAETQLHLANKWDKLIRMNLSA